MKKYNTINSITLNQPTSVAIGTFDGVHIGHQEVLRQMKEKTSPRIESFVYTFSNHPLSFVCPNQATIQIMTPEQKLHIFAQMGIDHVSMLPFDQRQMDYSPQSFVEEVLIKKLKARYVVVGHDFTFGEGNNATAIALKRFGEQFGFEVSIVPPVTYRGTRISSTLIRQYLVSGDLKSANTLLGRPHFILGVVKHGRGRGAAKLGYPTINTESYDSICRGVYFSRVTHEGSTYEAITNVGTNPTFEQDDVLRIETYILDFARNIYGSQVKIEFLARYRDEMKFKNKDQLIIQMDQDVVAARTYFDNNF